MLRALQNVPNIRGRLFVGLFFCLGLFTKTYLHSYLMLKIQKLRLNLEKVNVGKYVKTSE